MDETFETSPETELGSVLSFTFCCYEYMQSKTKDLVLMVQLFCYNYKIDIIQNKSGKESLKKINCRHLFLILDV